MDRGAGRHISTRTAATEQEKHRMAEKTAQVPAGAIDLDAMLEKREEALGSRDRFPFVFKGETYWCVDPTLADDDWTAELKEISEELRSEDSELEDAAVPRHYLGDEAWEKFVAAGGSSNLWGHALNQYLDSQRAYDDAGNPTQARRFSNRTQRRQKRR